MAIYHDKDCTMHLTQNRCRDSIINKQNYKIYPNVLKKYIRYLKKRNMNIQNTYQNPYIGPTLHRQVTRILDGKVG